MKYVIAPSILSADFTQLGKDIKETEEGGPCFCLFLSVCYFNSTKNYYP